MWDLHGITVFPSEFVTASLHHPHIGEEGQKAPAWKGRGGVEQEDQELDIYNPAIQSPGEACSSSQGSESKNRISVIFLRLF